MRSNILVLLALFATLNACSVKAGSGVPIPTGLPKPTPQQPATPVPAAKFTFNAKDSSNVWQAIMVNHSAADKATARINLRCTRATTYYRPTCSGGIMENNYLTSFAGDGFVTLFNEHLKMSDDKLRAEGRIFVECLAVNGVATCYVTEVQNPNYVN